MSDTVVAVDQPNIFTLAFILNETGQYVLLTRPKAEHHPFQGKLNGIGGKVRVDERPIDGVVREVEEETGIILGANDRFEQIVCMRYPNGNEMHVYYIVLEKADVFLEDREAPEGILKWYNVLDPNVLSACNPDIGGHGDVAYFINFSRILFISNTLR
jgi:8-oxo-dGTP pyrophosphatase MutT (NUDIX family)